MIEGNLLGDDGFKGPGYQDSVGGALVPVDTASMNYNPFNVNRFGANSQGRFNVNLRRRDTGIEGLKFGLNTNWQFGESLNTLIWERAYDGLYGTDGAATRTRQLVGTVDPYIEYLSPRGTQHSFRNRWQHLNNDNDNDQSNTSNVFYSEYQMQQRGDVWGVDGLVLTAGAVQQLTRGTAELYSGQPRRHQHRDQPLCIPPGRPKSGQRLNLSLGTRYEHFSINDSTAAKPVFRAELNFQAGQASWLQASVGQGFRFRPLPRNSFARVWGPSKCTPTTTCVLKPPSTSKPDSSRA